MPTPKDSSNLIRNYNTKQQGQYAGSLQIPKIQAPKLQDAAPVNDNQFKVTAPQAPSTEQLLAPPQMPNLAPYDVNAELNARLQRSLPTLLNGQPSDSERRTTAFYDFLGNTIEANRKLEAQRAMIEPGLLSQFNTPTQQRPNGFGSNVLKFLFGGEGGTADDGILGNEFSLRQGRFGQYGNGAVGGLMYGVDQTLGLGVLRNILLDAATNIKAQAQGWVSSGGVFDTLFKTRDPGRAIQAGFDRADQARREIYGDSMTSFFRQGLMGRDLGALGNLSGDAKDDYYKLYGRSPLAAGLDKAFFGRELTEQETKDYEKLTGFSVKEAAGLSFTPEEMAEYQQILGRVPDDFKTKMLLRNGLGLVADIGADDLIKPFGFISRQASKASTAAGAMVPVNPPINQTRRMENTRRRVQEWQQLKQGSGDWTRTIDVEAQRIFDNEQVLPDPWVNTKFEPVADPWVDAPLQRQLPPSISKLAPDTSVPFKAPTNTITNDILTTKPPRVDVPALSDPWQGANPAQLLDTTPTQVSPAPQKLLPQSPETEDLWTSAAPSLAISPPNPVASNDVASILAAQYQRRLPPGRYIMQQLDDPWLDPAVVGMINTPPPVVENPVRLSLPGTIDTPLSRMEEYARKTDIRPFVRKGGEVLSKEDTIAELTAIDEAFKQREYKYVLDKLENLEITPDVKIYLQGMYERHLEAFENALRAARERRKGANYQHIDKFDEELIKQTEIIPLKELRYKLKLLPEDYNEIEASLKEALDQTQRFGKTIDSMELGELFQRFDKIFDDPKYAGGEISEAEKQLRAMRADLEASENLTKINEQPPVKTTPSSVEAKIDQLAEKAETILPEPQQPTKPATNPDKAEILRKAREFQQKQKAGTTKVEETTAPVEQVKPKEEKATNLTKPAPNSTKEDLLRQARERLNAEKASRRAELAVKANDAKPVSGNVEVRVDIDKPGGQALIEDAVDLHGLFNKAYDLTELDSMLGMVSRAAAGAPVSFVGKVVPIAEASRSQKEIYRFASLVPDPIDASRPLLPPTESIIKAYKETYGVEHPYAKYAIKDSSMKYLTTKGGTRRHKTLERIAAEQTNPLYRKILSPGAQPIPEVVIQHFELQSVTRQALVRTSPDTVAVIEQNPVKVDKATAPVEVSSSAVDNPYAAMDRASLQKEIKALNNGIKANLKTDDMRKALQLFKEKGIDAVPDNYFTKAGLANRKKSTQGGTTAPVESSTPVSATPAKKGVQESGAAQEVSSEEEWNISNYSPEIQARLKATTNTKRVAELEKKVSKVEAAETIDEFEESVVKLEDMEPSLEELNKIEAKRNKNVFDHRKKISQPNHTPEVDVVKETKPDVAAKQVEFDELTTKLDEVVVQETKLLETKASIEVALSNVEIQQQARINKYMSMLGLGREDSRTLDALIETLRTNSGNPELVNKRRSFVKSRKTEYKKLEQSVLDLREPSHFPNYDLQRQAFYDTPEGVRAAWYLIRPNKAAAKQVTNPVVRIREDGSLDFISGRDTTLVLKDAGADTIPVQVVEDLRPKVVEKAPENIIETNVKEAAKPITNLSRVAEEATEQLETIALEINLGDVASLGTNNVSSVTVKGKGYSEGGIDVLIEPETWNFDSALAVLNNYYSGRYLYINDYLRFGADATKSELENTKLALEAEAAKRAIKELPVFTPEAALDDHNFRKIWEQVEEDVQPYIKDATDKFYKGELVLYRGTGGKPFLNLQVGDTFTDPAIVSTSFVREKAMNFFNKRGDYDDNLNRINPVLLVVENHKSGRLTSNTSEFEVLFDSPTFVITRIENDNGVKTIYVQEEGAIAESRQQAARVAVSDSELDAVKAYLDRAYSTGKDPEKMFDDIAMVSLQARFSDVWQQLKSSKAAPELGDFVTYLNGAENMFAPKLYNAMYELLDRSLSRMTPEQVIKAASDLAFGKELSVSSPNSLTDLFIIHSDGQMYYSGSKKVPKLSDGSIYGGEQSPIKETVTSAAKEAIKRNEDSTLTQITRNDAPVLEEGQPLYKGRRTIEDVINNETLPTTFDELKTFLNTHNPVPVVKYGGQGSLPWKKGLVVESRRTPPFYKKDRETVRPITINVMLKSETDNALRAAQAVANNYIGSPPYRIMNAYLRNGWDGAVDILITQLTTSKTGEIIDPSTITLSKRDAELMIEELSSFVATLPVTIEGIERLPKYTPYSLKTDPIVRDRLTHRLPHEIEDKPFYPIRGLPLRFVESLKKGDEFVEPSIISTTINEEHAVKFAKGEVGKTGTDEPGALMRFLTTENARATDNRPEQEIVFLPGTKFRVVNVSEYEGLPLYELEEVITKSVNDDTLSLGDFSVGDTTGVVMTREALSRQNISDAVKLYNRQIQGVDTLIRPSKLDPVPSQDGLGLKEWLSKITDKQGFKTSKTPLNAKRVAEFKQDLNNALLSNSKVRSSIYRAGLRESDFNKVVNTFINNPESYNARFLFNELMQKTVFSSLPALETVNEAVAKLFGLDKVNVKLSSGGAKYIAQLRRDGETALKVALKKMDRKQLLSEFKKVLGKDVVVHQNISMDELIGAFFQSVRNMATNNKTFMKILEDVDVVFHAHGVGKNFASWSDGKVNMKNIMSGERFQGKKVLITSCQTNCPRYFTETLPTYHVYNGLTNTFQQAQPVSRAVSGKLKYVDFPDTPLTNLAPALDSFSSKRVIKDAKLKVPKRRNELIKLPRTTGEAMSSFKEALQQVRQTGQLDAPTQLKLNNAAYAMEFYDADPSIAKQMRQVVRRMTGRELDEGKPFMSAAVDLLNDESRAWSREEIADLVSYGVGVKELRFAPNITDDEALKFGRIMTQFPETMSQFDYLYAGHGTGIVEHGTWSLEARPSTGYSRRELIQHVIDREFPKGTEVGVIACETGSPKRIQDAVPPLHRVVSRGQVQSNLDNMQRLIEGLSAMPTNPQVMDVLAHYDNLLRESLTANKERATEILTRMSQLEDEFNDITKRTRFANEKVTRQQMDAAFKSLEKELLDDGGC